MTVEQQRYETPINQSMGKIVGADGEDLAAPTMQPEAERQRGAQQARLANSFSNLVAVLMRDPGRRALQIADLEWLVIPPLLLGQCRFAFVPQPAPGAQAEMGSLFVPIAVALWARVSPEIDARLQESIDTPIRLRPNDWASGDIHWLIAAAGESRAMPSFLRQLDAREFAGRSVKMRSRSPDGRTVISKLSDYRLALPETPGSGPH